MSVKHLTQIFFSPTGTTRQVLSAIAAGIAPAEIRGCDLTPPENRENFNFTLQEKDEIVLMGIPVYEELIPDIVTECLNKIEGKGRPIVLVAVYGNVGYGTCLKDMNDWALKAGFKVIAAAAFIGEHSFSHKGLPLAEGRPDTHDLRLAKAFGKDIAEKISQKDISVPQISGKKLLMARVLPKNSERIFSRVPDPDMKKCTRCMRCMNVCPSGAIDPGSLKIDPTKCLHCFACVRVCAPEARKIVLKLKLLSKNALKFQTKVRKEPDIFI